MHRQLPHSKKCPRRKESKIELQTFLKPVPSNLLWADCPLLHVLLSSPALILTMSTITFVTGNANKLKEVLAILSEGKEGANKVGKFTISNKSLDLVEVQGTLEEVTIHKAQSAAEIVNGPVLVEDTGLGFTAFNDLPGPYIKWFVASVGLQGLVDMLFKFEDKSAKAITTLGYCEGPGKEVKLFLGVTLGRIVDSRGHKNFGWDSVFEPTGFNQTYAEMDKEVKNTISHRYKALEKLKEYLLSL